MIKRFFYMGSYALIVGGEVVLQLSVHNNLLVYCHLTAQGRVGVL